MSKFFTPIDFSDVKATVTEIKREIENEFPIDITNYITQFNRLLAAVESGQSEIIRHSVDLKNSPVRKALATLEKEPGANSLKNFLQAAEQDINRRARQELISILKGNEKINKYLTNIGVA